MTLSEKIKKGLISFWNILMYWYDLIVYKFLIYEDNDSRKKRFKFENPELYASGRRKLKRQEFLAKFDNRIASNKEQRMFVEALLMAYNYNNPEMLAIRGFTKRHDIRPATRMKFVELVKRKGENKLADSLEGLGLLYPEYIAMIRVAEGHRNFKDTYEFILEDLQDRIARKKAFMQLMIFPISAIGSIFVMEIFCALYLIPQITVSLGTDDFSSTPTLGSYVNLREILLYHKLEYAIKLTPPIVAFIFFLRLKGTKHLIDLALLQIPVVKTIVMRWEVSKFFNSLRGLVKSNFSVNETVNRSLGVITNKVMKMSLTRDIEANAGSSPHFYDMFKSSIYLEPHILNQLKIAKDNNSNAVEVLDNVYKEYKDVMKDIMDKPADLVMPTFSAIIAIYIAVRLLPIYTEINVLAEMMSRG